MDHTRVVSCRAGNLHGEVIPRAYSLIREVVNPLAALIQAALDDREQRDGQIPGIGRAAHLIEHHVQLGPLRRQSKHRLEEIVAVLRIEPRRTDYHGTASRCLYGLLAVQFRTSIRPKR